MAKTDSGGKRGFPPSGFGVKLDQLLAEKGISQKKLAEAADIHPNTIAKMKAGLIEPSWPMVLALSKALGVSCEAFSGCEDVQPDRAEDVPATKSAKVKPAATHPWRKENTRDVEAKAAKKKAGKK